jgi:RNA polymerase sigma-70 factor (ECF subfamily)
MALQAAVERPQPMAEVPATFGELYDAHADAMFRTLARLGVAAAHLEDAAQELFVTAWKKQSAFERRSSVRTWLTGIAVHIASHYRRNAGRRATEPLDDELAGSTPSPHDDAERRQGLELLQRVLSKLSDEQREVFVMMEMEGFSAPELSALLGIPENTIYSRLRLARTAFNTAVARLQAGAR